jgi:DNA modification methylase
MTVEYHIGDCFSIMPKLPDATFDLVLTDPPYIETNEKWDKAWDISAWWDNVIRLLKNDGVLVVFGKFKILSAIYQERQMKLMNDWVWIKPKSAFSHYHIPICVHEFVHVYGANKHNTDLTPMKIQGKAYKRNLQTVKGRGFKPMLIESDGFRHPKSVVYYNQEGYNIGDCGFPCPKPVALVAKLIECYSKQGDLVLDPFLGSGTTLRACRMTERNGIGIEINPEYEPIIKQRIMEKQPAIEKWFGDAGAMK